MPLPTGAGQGDLLLTLAEPSAVGLVMLVYAGRARHALLIGRAGFVGFRQGAATGVAGAVGAGLQPMTDRDAAIENIAFALPQALRLGDLLQIFEDPPFQVEHLFDPLPQKVIGGFLAADAPGAEHRDPLVVKAMLVRLPPGRKFAERSGLRVNRPLKAANPHFIIVARVDHSNVGRGNQRIPLLRRHIMPNPRFRVDIGLPHRHDLTLEPHFQPPKGLLGGKAFLMLKVPAARQSPNMGQHPGNPLCGTRDRAIDPFRGQQQRAANTLGPAKRQKRALQRGRVREAGEMIQGGYCKHGRSLGLNAAKMQEAALDARNTGF